MKKGVGTIPVGKIVTETIPISVAINGLLNLMFKIGEWVVHPQHGVGEIVMLEDSENELGKPHGYYEISILNGSTVWVQVVNPNSRLHYLATKSEIADCREILEAKPISLMVDSRVRQPELVV